MEMGLKSKIYSTRLKFTYETDWLGIPWERREKYINDWGKREKRYFKRFCFYHQSQHPLGFPGRIGIV